MPHPGAQAPRVCTWRLFNCSNSLYNVSAAKLALTLPGGISNADRANCPPDFERGRGHLLFQFTLKLAAYQKVPAAFFGVATTTGRKRLSR